MKEKVANANDVFKGFILLALAVTSALIGGFCAHAFIYHHSFTKLEAFPFFLAGYLGICASCVAEVMAAYYLTRSTVVLPFLHSNISRKVTMVTTFAAVAIAGFALVFNITSWLGG